MSNETGYVVLAEFSIHPIGKGTSVSKYIRAALAQLKEAEGTRILVTPMGTIIEARSLHELFAVVEKAHESVFKEGAARVSFTLRVDDRRDKKRRMEDKVASVS
jgi:uncharacterized protein (TIGR00106 family)